MYPPIELNGKQRAAFLEILKNYTHIVVKIHKPESYSTFCTYCVILNMTVRVFSAAIFLRSGYQMTRHLRDRLVSEEAHLIIIGTFLNTV
jgi:hypothetical protein